MAITPLNARTDAILRRLVRRDAGTALRKVLAKARPEDVAAAMAHLTGEHQRKLFTEITDKEFAASVLAELRDDAMREITRDMSDQRILELLSYMEPDDATDMVEILPEALRQRVITEMEGDNAHADVAELLSWPSDSAGGIMSNIVFRMPETATCGNAIATLQEHHEELENVYYLYVTDDEDGLAGVVSMRALLVHPPSMPLVSIMNRDVISVGPRTDQEEVARIVARYDLLAIPVLDEDQNLLGIVTVDDVIDVIREEAAEDMLRMAGVGDGAEDSARGVLRFTRLRAGWLLATAVGGVLADQTTHMFRDDVNMALLAGFIPVVMGMGGNVGIQSTTLAVRGLATGHVQVGGALPFIWRETQVGLLLGVLYGLLIGGYGIVTHWPDPGVGVSVGLSVFMAIGIGSVLGSSLPVGLSRLGIDPAIATGPFVTTAVDILGILVYFNVAMLLLPAP